MVRQLPVRVPNEPAEQGFKFVVDVPHDLAEEALRRTESEEMAVQYVLDRSYIEMDWGDDPVV